ncbi:MAG TPA: hypothetical protein VLV83_17540 [Acidobacteriota bacterium]|nr:hypothetical protein [Acidobacteriota bacterium]
MRKSIALTLLGLLGLAVAVPLAGCGQAQAEPLQVTYYFLPG